VARVEYFKASFQLTVIEVVGGTDRVRFSKEVIAAFKCFKNGLSRVNVGKKSGRDTAATTVVVGQYRLKSIGKILLRGVAER
jgi:hypothetical protein